MAGDGSNGKVAINSFKAESVSFLPEPSTISGYSAIQNQPGNDKDDRPGSCYDHFCNWIKKNVFSPTVKAEAKAVFRLSFGICANTFFGFFIPLTMTFIVGQKGKVELAAAGLGWSICNVSGHVYVIGVTSVCETFSSQAYGAKQMRRYGIILQRAVILTCISILPSCALWINMDKILLLIGQDREVAMLAGQFALWYIPGIFFFIFFNLLLRYLACQGIVYPSIYSAAVAFLVNGICCYVFVHVCDLGVRGGALAVDVAFLTYCVVLLVFIFWKKLHIETWHGWSYDCLCDWKEFIALSASSIVMSVSEWICFEVGIIALGIVGSMEQAVQIVLYDIAGMMYFVTVSFSIAAAVRVGNFIGSGNPKLAKISASVSLALAVLSSACTGLVLFALHDYIVYVFTSDRSVIEIASKLIYLILVISVFDSLEVVSLGIVRGLGYQKFGAIINFLAFLCLGTLSYMLLVFKANLGVRGYWFGVSIGIVVETTALFILLYLIDWKKLSKSVRENVGVIADWKSDDNKDEADAVSLKLQSQNSVEFHVNDAQNEDICLISETGLSYYGENDECRKEENTDQSNAAEDGVKHSNNVNECETFFVYKRPQFSKLDIFIKVSAVLVLLLGVMASAVVRLYL